MVKFKCMGCKKVVFMLVVNGVYDQGDWCVDCYLKLPSSSHKE